MPKLWVFRRVPELNNRTGWLTVADDALADRLVKEDKATRRVDPRKRRELPGHAITPTDSVAVDVDPPPRKGRKAKASE